MLDNFKYLAFMVALLSNYTSFQGVEGHLHPHENRRGFLYDKDINFVMDLDINVVFAGFNGDGAKNAMLDVDDFQLSLSNSLEVHQPNCIQTQQPLHVEYHLKYNVIHLNNEAISRIERLLSKHMKLIGYTNEWIDQLRVDDLVDFYNEDKGNFVEGKIQMINQSNVLLQELGQNFDQWLSRTNANIRPLHTVSQPLYAHKNNFPDPRQLLYEIEVTEIEKEFEKICDASFGEQSIGEGIESLGFSLNLGSEEKGRKKTPATQKVPYSIVIINPDKHRLRPQIQSVPGVGSQGGFHPFIYRYRYNGGPPNQNWIGRHRYVFADISSGPCEYGTIDSEEGSVSIETIPTLEVEVPPTSEPNDETDVGEDEVRASIPGDQEHEKIHRVTLQCSTRLSSLVISSIKHVFANDIEYQSLHYAEQVIIPIVVLRNHQRFDPLGETTIKDGREDFAIDIKLLRQEVEKMLLPHQELILVTNVHNLYEHRSISTAVFKALKGDTIHTTGEDGEYQAKTIFYLDSKIFQDEIKHATDLLTTGLLQENEKMGGTHNSDLLFEEENENEDSWFKTAEDFDDIPRSSGHQILPVFVFSLLGFADDLLFDGKMLHLSTSSSVMVLQTGDESIELPFFSEDDLITVNSRMITKQITAGIAKALGGLVSPHSTYSLSKQRMTSNYLWSMGHHPFGPFSSSIGVSQIFLDNILRNSILSRVNYALKMVREAVNALDQFIIDYLYDGFQPIEYTRSRKLSDAVNQLWNSGNYNNNGNGLLASTMVSRLVKEISQMENQFTEISESIKNYQLSKANTLSGSLTLRARAFSRYVWDELDIVRSELDCCTKSYEKIRYEGWSPFFLYFFIFSIG